MYPNLYFAFLDLLGWDLPALKLINSFGFFVALAFLVAHACTKLSVLVALCSAMADCLDTVPLAHSAPRPGRPHAATLSIDQHPPS